MYGFQILNAGPINNEQQLCRREFDKSYIGADGTVYYSDGIGCDFGYVVASYNVCVIDAGGKY